MPRTKVILNITSFFIFILGFTYIALSNYYMGFERDLVYREHILEQEYLSYVNFIFLTIFWGVFSFLHFKSFYVNTLYIKFLIYLYLFFFVGLLFCINLILL